MPSIRDLLAVRSELRAIEPRPKRTSKTEPAEADTGWAARRAGYLLASGVNARVVTSRREAPCVVYSLSSGLPA